MSDECDVDTLLHHQRILFHFLRNANSGGGEVILLAAWADDLKVIFDSVWQLKKVC